MLLSLTACGTGPQIQTVVAPDAGLDHLRTFRVVPASAYLGDVLPGSTSPAFLNSTTEQELGKTIAVQLERRGYAVSESSPDVLVEYETAVKEELDPTDWSFSYLWRPNDWRGWGPSSNDATPAEYTHGAVVIDVVDARTNQLLWRGHAAADPTGDPAVTVRGLDRTVAAILDRFPGRTLALAKNG
jgi:hypothetical protein